METRRRAAGGRGGCGRRGRRADGRRPTRSARPRARRATDGGDGEGGTIAQDAAVDAPGARTAARRAADPPGCRRRRGDVGAGDRPGVRRLAGRGVEIDDQFDRRAARHRAVALGLAFAIQAFIVKPYRIPSGSMEPTLSIGQRVLVNRLGMHFADPTSVRSWCSIRRRTPNSRSMRAGAAHGRAGRARLRRTRAPGGERELHQADRGRSRATRSPSSKATLSQRKARERPLHQPCAASGSPNATSRRP